MGRIIFRVTPHIFSVMLDSVKLDYVRLVSVALGWFWLGQADLGRS
jgi:hypothetical protein